MQIASQGDSLWQFLFLKKKKWELVSLELFDHQMSPLVDARVLERTILAVHFVVGVGERSFRTESGFYERAGGKFTCCLVEIKSNLSRWF